MGRLFSRDDSSRLDQLDEQRMQQNEARNSAEETTVYRIANLARTYTGISPGLAYALGSSGVDVGEQANELWQSELKARYKRKPGVRKNIPTGRRENGYLFKQAKNGNVAAQKEIKKRLKTGRANLGDLMDMDGGLLSDIGDVAGDAAGLALEGLDKVTPAPVKIAGNVGMTALQAGYEAGQAGYRTFASRPGFKVDTDGVEWDVGSSDGVPTLRSDQGLADVPGILEGQADKIVQQTTLGQGIVYGEDMGDSLLPSPDSDAAQAQAEAARKFSPYLIHGHAITPGRVVADTVLEEDDDKFNVISGLVDGFIAVKADPANLVLGASGNYRKAKKTIERDELIDAGIYQNGARHGFTPTKFSVWEAKPKTQEAYAAIAADGSAYSLWKHTGIADRDLLREYALADTPDAVSAVTRGYIGGQGLPHGVKYDTGLRFKSRNMRMNTDVPGVEVDLGPNANIMDALTEIDNSLVNIHGSEAIRERVFNDVINSATDIVARDQAMRGVYDAHAEILRAVGLPDDIIQKTKAMAFGERLDDASYIDDSITQQTLFNPDQVQVGTKSIRIGDAATQDVLVNNKFVLPDFRELRRMTHTGVLREILNHPLYKGSTEATDEVMSLWRKSAIGRPATGLRVVGEEQMRIAMDGFNSLGAHPLSAIAMAIGSPDSTWITKLNKRKITAPLASAIEEFKGKYGVKPYMLGENQVDSPLFEALYPRFGALTGDRKVALQGYTKLALDHPEAAPALAEELMHLRENPIVRSLIERGIDQTQKHFWDGDLAHNREFLSTTPSLSSLKYDRTVADAEIVKYGHMIQDATGNNPDFINAIRTGFVRGHRVMNPNGPNAAGVRQLRAVLTSDQSLPNVFYSSRYRVMTESQKHRVIRNMDNGMNAILDTVLSRPSNFFSRNVLKEQAYLASMKEAFPYMDRAGRKRLLDNMGAANLAKKDRRIFEDMNRKLSGIEDAYPSNGPFLTKAQAAAKKAEAGGVPLQGDRLTFEAANVIASRRAVNHTRDLLYDLSKKSQFFDSMRTVFPFGEAWKEVMTRWAKLTWENPRVIRRFSQGIWAAKGEGSDVINTVTGNPATGQGFFSTDQYGQEVFNYPGSSLLNEQLMGIPIPLTGRVSGLNMVGTGLPGFGPVVQIPTSYFLPDKPAFDEIRSIIAPIGAQPGSGDLFNTAVDSMFPSWFNKMRKGFFANPNSDRVYASTVFDVARYLQSTGEYKTQGPNAQAETNRLMNDSKKGAKTLYIIRGMGQATLPSAPTPSWVINDKQGKLLLAWSATKWYQKKVKKVGYEQAYEEFLNHFGTDNFLMVQPKSKATIPNAPVKTNAFDWARNNPAIRERYPHVYGLFAPSGGEFSIQAYQKSIEHGERKTMTPEEMVSAANSRLATVAYNRAKAVFGESISEAEASLLRDLRTTLVHEFPGYQSQSVSFTQRSTLISELKDAAQDSRVYRTPAGKALRKYLMGREVTLSSMGGTGLTAKTYFAQRLALLARGEELVDKYPDFQPMWDTVFKPELGRFDG